MKITVLYLLSALMGLAASEPLSLPITFDLEKAFTVTVVIDDASVGTSLTGTPFALEKGLHPLRVEFRQYGGTAGVRLDWSGPNGKTGPIPATAFTRTP